MPISEPAAGGTTGRALGRSSPAATRTGCARRTALRWLASTHRWLGIAFCLFFATWFITGAIMIYVPFPSLSEAERLRGLTPFDTRLVAVSPGEAAAASGFARLAGLRLHQGVAGPVYLALARDGATVAVDALSGVRLPPLDGADAASVAARFAHATPVRVTGPFRYDQWTVHQHFDPVRPFWRVDLDDARGTQLYVSRQTGDVVQQTRHLQRALNWVAAVIHWIYPTIIRRSFVLWDNLVWCVALVGLTMAAAGLTLGVTRTRKALAHRRAASISPFKGLFRWHHLNGLIAGVFVVTWIFSGWLSVDHGRLFSTGIPTDAQRDAVRALGVEQAAAMIPLARVRALGTVAEVAFTAFDGRPLLVSQDGVHTPELIPDAVIAQAVGHAWPSLGIRSVRPIAPDDLYGNLVTEKLPPTARRVVFNDDPPTWVHVDAASGDIIEIMDRSRRIYRWAFYGLHTFDLPGLSERPLLRQTVMLALLGGGLSLSLTGAVLGARRLRRLVPRSINRSPIRKVSR